MRKRKVEPQKIAKARISLGMTQNELAIQLMELIPTDRRISAMQISSWETGRRPCPEAYLQEIARMSNVPVEEFYYEPKVLEGDDTSVVFDERTVQIPFENLYLYDKKPVYVVFENYQRPSAWGLYSRNTSEVIFTDYIISVTEKEREKLSFYYQEPQYKIPYSEFFHRKLDLNYLFSAERVYVVMDSPDEEIRRMYNGWYKHNNEHTSLQKEDNGIALPYAGLGVSYMAYYAQR